MLRKEIGPSPLLSLCGEYPGLTELAHSPTVSVKPARVEPTQIGAGGRGGGGGENGSLLSLQPAFP